MIERSSLEICENEAKSKEFDKLNDKMKKLKNELERKDITIDSYKNKIQKLELETKDFDDSIKEKQTNLSKDLQELNKKCEQ